MKASSKIDEKVVEEKVTPKPTVAKQWKVTAYGVRNGVAGPWVEQIVEARNEGEAVVIALPDLASSANCIVEALVGVVARPVDEEDDSEA